MLARQTQTKVGNSSSEEDKSAARLGAALFQCKNVHSLFLDTLVHDELKFNIEM